MIFSARDFPQSDFKIQIVWPLESKHACLGRLKDLFRLILPQLPLFISSPHITVRIRRLGQLLARGLPILTRGSSARRLAVLRRAFVGIQKPRIMQCFLRVRLTHLVASHRRNRRLPSPALRGAALSGRTFRNMLHQS